MSLDGPMRLRPVRRTILLGIGASAAALWSATLRVARATPPDQSHGSVPRPMPAAPAVLYEEDPDAPNGRRFAGYAHWDIDTRPDANGGAAETIVRARVEVRERGMILVATFGRNRDKSLPASHTIELIITLPLGFAHGGIENVPGILMKESETARGTPLGGLSVKVTTLFFLIGLSQVEQEHAANMHLLHERAWFDLPIVYSDKRRAILAFAKGEEGERAFSRAFAAWDDEAAAPTPGGGVLPGPGGGDSPAPGGDPKGRGKSK